MLKMVDGTGIIGVDMVCPLGGAVSPPQPPNFDKVEMEGVGSLTLPNSLKAPLERLELIGNSTQGENPAPDNPQEIKSAGRKSRNLLNLQKQPDVKETYLGWKVSDGRNVVLSVKDKGNNADITGCYLGLSRTGGSSDGVVWAVNNGSVAAKEVVSKNQYVSVFPSNETTVRKLLERFDIQVEYGGNATDYEPYGYLLDLKVIGKNLFDSEKARDINNWTDSIVQPGYIDFSIYVGKGNSVNISYSENLEAGLGFYAGIAQSVNNGILYWLYHSSTQYLNKNNYKLIAECDYISVRVIKSNLQGFLEDIKTLQIENSNTPTSYEPYTEQSVQITLDEPLRGIGEYKDTITKDGAVRKIAPYEVNLNDLRDGGYSKTNTVMFSVKVQNKTVGYASSKPSILCNILPDCALQMSNIYNNDKECIAVGGGIVLFRVNKSRLKDISSFEATKQSFIELMADKKMIVEYALETPVTEPLPESVQQQLQALHSENGTTHVFVDSGEVPCGIKLTYRKEK